MAFAMLFACENPWMAEVLQEKTVYFDSNGGSSVPSQKLFQGERVARPDNPVKSGNVFEGWYKDNWTFEQPYDFNFIPINSMTLYAKWRETTPDDLIIKKVDVQINGPATGETQTVEYPEGGTGYVCDQVTWSPNDGVFKGNTIYTVVVTLTTIEDYIFSNSIIAKINGIDAKKTDQTQTSINLSYTFTETDSKIVKEISIIEQPLKLTYTYGEKIDLTGLKVKLTYNDDTYVEEIFIGNNKNISASPAHDDPLYFLEHNGKPVVVSFGSKHTSTYDLTVNKATPTADDFDISGNRSQTIGSVIPITITRKPDKTTGVITVYYKELTATTTYTNSTINSAPAGTYNVTFDVEADDNWNEAKGLSAGTLMLDSVFTNGAALAAYLTKQPSNASNNPVTINMKISDVEELTGIADVLKKAGRYVNLNLYDSNITEIPNYTFHIIDGDDKLVEIILPNGITKIGESAFRACKGLNKINIQESVENIGDYAFAGCNNLTDIIIPESVKSIGAYAFYDCFNLKSINIPVKVESISNNVFCNCNELESIIIPDSIKSIGKHAFWGCNKLTKVEFEGEINQALFDSDAFPIGDLRDKYYATNSNNGTPGKYTRQSDSNIWAKPDIINSFNSIEDFQTYLQNQPANIATAPYNIKLNVDDVSRIASTLQTYGVGKYVNLDLSGSTFTDIKNEVFSECSSLTSIIIPNNVKRIGEQAFYSCTNLTSITIPIGVTSIEDQAFYGCDKLSSVNIPNSVTSIGGAVFSGTSITAINVAADNSVYTAQDGVLYNKDKTILHTYPAGRAGAFTIPSSVTNIENSAFFCCKSLTNITIPSSVTSIEISAFYDCTGLTSVTFNGTIPSSRFNHIETFPGDLRAKFYAIDTTNGTPGTYTRPNGSSTTWTRSPFVFANVTEFKTYLQKLSANIAAKPYTIELNAIGNSDIKSLKVMLNDNSDKYVNLDLSSNTITDIGYQAFEGCENLTGITLPDSVDSIGNVAFASCANLTYIAMQNKVKSIGNEAFIGCTSLKNITIPNSVTSIGNAAFEACTNLISVTFNGTIPSSGFDNNAFIEIGDLRDKFYATNSTSGTPGTYSRPSGTSTTWTKIP